MTKKDNKLGRSEWQTQQFFQGKLKVTLTVKWKSWGSLFILPEIKFKVTKRSRRLPCPTLFLVSFSLIFVCFFLSLLLYLFSYASNIDLEKLPVPSPLNLPSPSSTSGPKFIVLFNLLLLPFYN